MGRSRSRSRNIPVLQAVTSRVTWQSRAILKAAETETETLKALSKAGSLKRLQRQVRWVATASLIGLQHSSSGWAVAVALLRYGVPLRT
ncbi:hypothetical protein V6N13_074417 [Hibiscus sabdariffa]|uniref:Uncharacterized protein n=1 Tax=Hibiscus sabdariffa TaxID=183260 RepID=A0ABR2U8M8_9ROSI